MKPIKDGQEIDSVVLRVGGKFTRRYLNQSGKKIDFGDQDLLLSESEPGRERLIRLGTLHTSILKEAGLPFEPIIYLDENDNRLPSESVNSREAKSYYLDEYFIVKFGEDRDSTLVLSARIVLHSCLALYAEAKDPLKHAFLAGEASALHEVYRKQDNQTRKYLSRKATKTNPIRSVIRELRKKNSGLTVAGLWGLFKDDIQKISVSSEIIEYWRPKGKEKVSVRIKEGKVKKYAMSTFRNHVTDVKKEEEMLIENS